MKKVVLAVCLMFISSGAWAEWQLINWWNEDELKIPAETLIMMSHPPLDDKKATFVDSTNTNSQGVFTLNSDGSWVSTTPINAILVQVRTNDTTCYPMILRFTSDELVTSGMMSELLYYDSITFSACLSEWGNKYTYYLDVFTLGEYEPGPIVEVPPYVEDPKPTRYVPLSVIDFVELANAGERFDRVGKYYEYSYTYTPLPYNIVVDDVNIELSGYGGPQFIEGRGIGQCAMGKYEYDKWIGVPQGADPETYCKPNVPLSWLNIKTDTDIRISEITLSNKYGETKFWPYSPIITSATVYDPDTDWDYEYGRSGLYHISRKVKMDFIIRDSGRLGTPGAYIKSMTIERGVYDSGAPSVEGAYRPVEKPAKWLIDHLDM